MYRTIFEIGPFALHSYGLMIALAFFAGIWYVKKRSRAENLPFEKMLTIAYILVFCGVIGARLSYVFLHLPEFADDPLSAINPFHGDHFGIAGLNLYGGVILAVLATLLYLRIKKQPLLPVFDLFAPAMGLGIGIGRIGCFLNGCCFGIPTNLPWGITFPPDSIPYAYFGSQPIHPSQLYTSAYGWILFVILHRIIKRKRFDGQVLAALFMMESVFRYLIEYVRYYETEMKFSFLGMEPTYNQLASLLLFIGGLILYLKAPRKLYRETDFPEQQASIS